MSETKVVPEVITNPEQATLAELARIVREFDAGSMKLAAKDEQAVDEEARRLEPEIERLTDGDEQN